MKWLLKLFRRKKRDAFTGNGTWTRPTNVDYVVVNGRVGAAGLNTEILTYEKHIENVYRQSLMQSNPPLIVGDPVSEEDLHKLCGNEEDKK